MAENDLQLEGAEVNGYAQHCLRTERRAGFAFTLMGAGLMLAWSLLDFALEPAHARIFLLLRACVVVLGALFCVVLRRTQSLRVVRAVAAASIISAGAACSYMLPRIDHHGIYLMGFSCVFWGSGLLYHWPPRVAAGTYFVVFANFVLCDALAPRAQPLVDLAGGVFYIATAALLMTVLAGVRTVADRRAYMLGARLDRTNAEAIARERALRLLMDSTEDGMVGVELSGAVTGNATAAVVGWFGPITAGQKIWDYVAPHDEEFRESFELGFEQLAGGLFPFEAAAGQMRPRLERGGLVYGIRFRPVLEDGAMVRVLVILTDVTSAVEGERAQRTAREVEAVMLSFVRDRAGMIAFVREAERILLDLEHVDEPATVRRLVHTLKGGSSAAGFVTVAEECHAIENELLESGNPTLERAQHVRLFRAFHERLGMIAELLPSDDGAIRLASDDLRELETAMRAGVHHDDLLGIIELWRWPHVRDALRRVAVQTERIATSLHKRVEVRVEDHGLRHVPQRLDEFFSSLVHVARNAVDHGIEDSAQRASVGKPEIGLITISARVVGPSLVIEMADDGGGIDVEQLRISAEKRGLHVASEDDVTNVLFSDGVSTRTEVTEHSGRGVGLAAVRAAGEAAGGTVRVTWRAGHGTTFAFHFERMLARGIGALRIAA